MADGFDIHIDPEQAARLRAAAERLGVSPSEYARELIEAGLDDLPPRTIDPDPAIDEAIADAVEAGEEETISLEEFRAQLRSFGRR
ncbi:antitoxin [Caulobacter flavus]|uniref:Antitoxin n=1 Tax=Caulobacter flavus TaxID=1679497 RepID=A0A2N5CL19_9CAUL|nr:ribbon-helix-helix domain-containing protein [Caulobacter flavus]AYV46729.1 antitoxin [Caulobacter flavus]PLR06342.1 antitoxin [Caulobacter flavus]